MTSVRACSRDANGPLGVVRHVWTGTWPKCDRGVDSKLLVAEIGREQPQRQEDQGRAGASDVVVLVAGGAGVVSGSIGSEHALVVVERTFGAIPA